MSSIEMSNLKTGGEEKEIDDMFGEDTGRVMTEEEANEVIAEARIRNPEFNDFFDMLENQDSMITESQDILAESFDATGDEALLRIQRQFEEYWEDIDVFLEKTKRLEVTEEGEIKEGEMPPQEEIGDLSDLFQDRGGVRRTTFLEKQLNRFRTWRENIRKANLKEVIQDDLDLFPDLEEAEEEIVLYDREAEDALARMNQPEELGDIEMTTRGDPRVFTSDEGDLFDNMFGETKTSSGNMEEIMGQGELPPEISAAGTAEDFGIIMEGDDILRVGGQVLDLETGEGTEMLSKIASVVGEYSETSSAVSRGLSLAGDVLGVVGVGLAVGSTIYQIYDGIATEEKYEEAGETYIKMGQDIEKINGALRMSYNTKAKQNNAYTELYTKWIFNKSNPSDAGKGRQMPLFNYSSDFDSISEDKRMDKISTFMISSVIQKQQSDLSKIPPEMRLGLQLLYNTNNARLKKNIIEGLDRVSQGEENTKWNWLKDMVGVDPDSMDDLRSVDIKAQVKGGVRLKRIYDAYREMDMRGRFMKKVYEMDRTSYTKQGKSREIELGSMDPRILSHWEQQTKDDTQFNTALQARTDEINKNFKWRVDREYAKHFQDVNVKWNKQEDMLKGLPAALKAPAIRLMEERRKAEWKMWNKKKQKAYGVNLSREQVLQNNYPKKYQFMIDLKKQKPYWIEYFKANRAKYYRNDMNEILSNRKRYLLGRDKPKPQPEDKAPKPYTGQDDSDDYNPFIDPTTDIKRKINPKWKPPKPIKPIPKKPDEPIKPKPKPIPRRRPKRVIPKTGQKKLLGQEDLWDFEPEKDNEFDEDIGFDIDIAQHLLHLCEHSYKAFDDDYFPTNTDTVDYDVATTMGSESFGVSEQGRMYYSRKDNVISIAYRGTDFGRTYTRPDLFVADLINDVDMRAVQYEGLMVHSGFLDFYLKTQDEVMNFINRHIGQDTKIYTTGHSYGAPPSMILAYMLNKHYEERRALCYTFGSPRGFDRESVKTIASQLTAFRVADIQDPITLLPPSSSGYYHAGRTIYLDGDVMKEIESMDEADSLYNIGGSSILQVGGLGGLIFGIQKMLHGISTPEQVSLANRLGSFFNNFVNPAQAMRNIYGSLKDVSLYAMYFSGQIANPSVRSSRYSLRNTPERINRMNIMRTMRHKHSQVIIDRFIAQYPKTQKYLDKEMLSDMAYGGRDSWSDLMKTEGKGRWTKRLIDVIDGTNSAPRDAITGFFNQMELMMFPEKIEEYQEYMRNMGLGKLLGLFPSSVQLTSAVLTAGGVVSLATMVGAVYKTYSFIELNKHALERYDELLSHHNQEHTLKGGNVRTVKDMLKGMDSVKDDEGNFYSTTPDEFDETPIFTQTDNDHLKFIPKYHRDTGITMMPIPHNLRGAIIGFTILSEEQYNSPNMIKGLVAY